MTQLSVNVNKVATLRNSRGGDNPNVVRVALDCEKMGAQGITVHPRPDERHITYKDVMDLSKVVTTELNIEGYPDERYMEIIRKVKPTQATLVPDPPHVLTSNAGWDCKKHQDFLHDIVTEIKDLGIRASLFLDPDPDMVEAAAATGTHRIELYTEQYAVQYKESPEKAIAPYVETAEQAIDLGLEINAGHDLSLVNLNYMYKNLPGLQEVSIGHALICDALYLGLENTIQLYLKQLT